MQACLYWLDIRAISTLKLPVRGRTAFAPKQPALRLMRPHRLHGLPFTRFSILLPSRHPPQTPPPCSAGPSPSLPRPHHGQPAHAHAHTLIPPYAPPPPLQRWSQPQPPWTPQWAAYPCRPTPHWWGATSTAWRSPASSRGPPCTSSASLGGARKGAGAACSCVGRRAAWRLCCVCGITRVGGWLL